jgi:hypothetical protein
MTQCQGIYFISGWTASIGSRMEFYWAIKLGLTMMFENQREVDSFFRGSNITIDDTGEWLDKQMEDSL